MNDRVWIVIGHLPKDIPYRNNDPKLLLTLPDQGLFLCFPLFHLSAYKFPKQCKGFSRRPLTNQKAVLFLDQCRYNLCRIHRFSLSVPMIFSSVYCPHYSTALPEKANQKLCSTNHSEGLSLIASPHSFCYNEDNERGNVKSRGDQSGPIWVFSNHSVENTMLTSFNIHGWKRSEVISR